ncbi:hypothetical protein OIU78_027321 [Salix suchowensis]|nr:hypothetical protein OIU78_027321 [Salix suchowensis]
MTQSLKIENQVAMCTFRSLLLIFDIKVLSLMSIYFLLALTCMYWSTRRKVKMHMN